MAHRHDAKLVGNHRKLHLETVVSDLALVAESWDDCKAMLDAVAVRCRDSRPHYQLQESQRLWQDCHHTSIQGQNLSICLLMMSLQRWRPTSNTSAALCRTTAAQLVR